MNLPKLVDLNSAQFLDEAFETEANEKMQRNARLHRNVHLWIFVTGIACFIVAAITLRFVLGMLSLLLAALSLKTLMLYNTQLRFLSTLTLRPIGEHDQ